MVWRLKSTGVISTLALAVSLGCTGSELFTYQHEAPKKVTIDLHIDSPPVITLVVVAPLQTDVGSWISLMGTADDPEGDDLSFLWTTTGGKVEEPHSRETRLTCTKAGSFVLTLTVTDRPGLKQTMNVKFVCG